MRGRSALGPCAFAVGEPGGGAGPHPPAVPLPARPQLRRHVPARGAPAVHARVAVERRGAAAAAAGAKGRSGVPGGEGAGAVGGGAGRGVQREAGKRGWECGGVALAACTGGGPARASSPPPAAAAVHLSPSRAPPLHAPPPPPPLQVNHKAQVVATGRLTHYLRVRGARGRGGAAASSRGQPRPGALHTPPAASPVQRAPRRHAAPPAGGCGAGRKLSSHHAAAATSWPCRDWTRPRSPARPPRVAAAQGPPPRSPSRRGRTRGWAAGARAASAASCSTCRPCWPRTRRPPRRAAWSSCSATRRWPHAPSWRPRCGAAGPKRPQGRARRGRAGCDVLQATTSACVAAMAGDGGHVCGSVWG
jgi:hypothetical protein